MNYGIPTLMEFPDIEDLAAFCRNHGFSFIEMNMTFPWFQMGSVTAERLRDLKNKYGIGLTIHLHDQVNPFEFSPEMRRGHLENIQFAMELADALDITRLTMHLIPGTYSSINGKKKYLYEQCKDHYLDLVQAFIRFADKSLDGSSTLICLENTGGFLPFQREAIDLMLQSDHFGLTFDIGHNYKAGGGDEAFILVHDQKLKHFHIHDCSLKSNHLAFGAAGLDLVRYLKMAESYGCSVVAEVKESSALLQSKKYLMDHKLWNNA
ncbi:MAG: sugar phosphate isomerase/epimerase [Clostridia bacterium]|nr:sugar phosphate isomerase/epimerase [Clostridia bacterium]